MKHLILLVGPTCSGKSTLEKALRSRGIPSVRSYTTRAPRANEQDGVDYDFVTKASIDRLMAAGKVIQRVVFEGNYYGSTVGGMSEAFDKSNIAVIVVEPTGVDQFRQYAETVEGLKVHAIYINGDYERIVHRLIERVEDDEHADRAYAWRRLVQQRLAYLEWPSYTDYSLTLERVDDEVPGHTTEDAIAKILAAINEPVPQA